MKAIAILSGMFLAACLVAVATSGQPAPAPQPQEQATSERHIHDLLVQRRDTLRQLLESLQVNYEAGAGQGAATLGDLVRAREELFKAELELAQTKAERLQIHQSRLESLRQVEAIVQARYMVRTMGGSADKLYAAQAARLAAEIDLAREQAAQ